MCCSPWGHKESDTTERVKNNNGVRKECQGRGEADRLEKLPPPCPYSEAMSTLPAPGLPPQKYGHCLHSNQSLPLDLAINHPFLSSGPHPCPLPQKDTHRTEPPTAQRARWAGKGVLAQKVYGSPYDLDHGWFSLSKAAWNPNLSKGIHFIQVHAPPLQMMLQMMTTDNNPKPRKIR